MRLMFKGIAFVAMFTLGGMYLPFPLNGILLGLGLLVIILGVVVEVVNAYRRTSDRFWNALERPEPPAKPVDPTAPSDYLPYVTARYRRLR